MPFAQNWTEELVAEWLQLKGYVVEVGLPVSISNVGGRFCADIVGARINGNSLEIVHLEVGGLSGKVQADIERLQKKFSAENQASIEQYFGRLFGFTGSGNVKFKRMYVASYCTPSIDSAAKEIGIDFHKLEDFIGKHILPTIREWKEKQKQLHHSKSKASYITLPEAHWLLKLIDFLSYHQLLNMEQIQKAEKALVNSKK